MILPRRGREAGSCELNPCLGGVLYLACSTAHCLVRARRNGGAAGSPGRLLACTWPERHTAGLCVTPLVCAPPCVNKRRSCQLWHFAFCPALCCGACAAPLCVALFCSVWPHVVQFMLYGCILFRCVLFNTCCLVMRPQKCAVSHAHTAPFVPARGCPWLRSSACALCGWPCAAAAHCT